MRTVTLGRSPYATTEAAMTALENGEVDLLIRNVLWTLSDDSKGLEFGLPIFYTGEGIMLRSDNTAKTWKDLNSKTVCVVRGSTAESEILAECDDGASDGGVVGVGEYVADEGLVDLQLVERQAFEIGQRGIACAEVV